MSRRPPRSTLFPSRRSSDLLLARALGAREVSLWKDVPGLLTADPRIVPDARVVPQVHLREAAELAYYGAKVLHRSEEHTSELQSQSNLVCRLLLEKKKLHAVACVGLADILIAFGLLLLLAVSRIDKVYRRPHLHAGLVIDFYYGDSTLSVHALTS